MKSKYEISIWNDIPDKETGLFKEEKLIVIGSDTMTSESRAREPKMVNNINGTNKFSFNLYYNYIDTRTGEMVENPYIKYLVNERKIKVLWKNKWYDMFIKQIKEDQVNHLFTYSCEDAYVTELSRTGFELVFDTELENNIGTAEELIDKTIENTDWRFNKEKSDIIYQKTEEPVYEAQTLSSFNATRAPSGESVEIQSGLPILLYYSYAPDINNLKNDIQFYYSGTNQWQHDINDMLVINGDCYNITVEWVLNNNVATARLNGQNLFTINFLTGLSTEFRAERYVQSQKAIYNNIVDQYVNVYNDGALLGYQSTEYNDALAVVNLFTNPSNFSNTSGWIGNELYFKLSPSFNKDTDISTYTATSFLRLKQGIYFNTGIQNNRPYIKDGFIQGERYVFRIKAKADGEEPANTSYIKNPNLIHPSIQGRDRDYLPTGGEYFSIIKSKYDEEEHWLEYNMECIKSCPYEMILSSSSPFGLFIETTADYWIEEAQFYKEIYGNTGYSDEVIRIDPGKMNLQSIAQPVWKYFNAEQASDITKDTLQYVYTSLEEWDQAIPVYNNYERYGTIEESNSNRFNILQTIAEKFECWVRFEIEHDDKGYIIYDNGAPRKWVYVTREAGQETGIGFIYGVDLKGITRNLKSDKLSTKTIVQQNENEFGKNGFCSIARSQWNYPRENVIYNFDYYIQHGLLDRSTLYNDLYTTSGLGFYSKLHTLNVEYANNLDKLLNKKNELTKQNAMATVYEQYILSSREELQTTEESIMKLAGVTTFDAAEEYVKGHLRDTKIQSLMNDRSSIKNIISNYQALQGSLQASIDLLTESIESLESRQDEIIDSLNDLNKQFYSKYARYIQEGTWTSEDYWDDDLYYLDAMQVAYTSSRPQISYEINVLRLSDLPEYSSKVFQLGDISFVQDVKYFGYLDDRITPYKEKVILTEITSYFDTPDKDVIKVQNYKTQFDDLFQRIAAATQNLEFAEGKYARAANIVNSDGTIKSSVIQNTFDTNKDLVYGAQNESATIDNTGITVTDNADAAKQVKVTSGGVFVTNDGGMTWRNAIRGDGISTDLLTAGRINTEQITVYNGEHPSFRWDPNGLNAYKFNSDGAVDTTQFVRFDQFGIYGIQNAPEVYIPASEAQIYQDANFGLTWNKFFMKSVNGDKSIEISTDRDIVVKSGEVERIVIGRVDGPTSDNYGIHVRNADNETVFQCDNEGSYLSGWSLTKDYLESSTGPGGQTIKIFADGNIGCYGHEAEERTEAVYIVQVLNAFSAIGLNSQDRDISAGEVIYPFVSLIGKTKTQYQIAGKYNSQYMAPTSDYIPVPPSSIQLVYNTGIGEYNYLLENIQWNVTLNKASYIETTEGDQTYTTYIYTFNLTAIKDNITLFTIGYTEEYNTSKRRYIPASETTWKIDNNGDAIFHEILADGGSIAGWWIDNEKIYQTYDGTRNGKIKTQLNSNGTANKDGFDYSIITDAINASMASIGGVLMSGGLINGYSIAALANQVANAYGIASSAMSRANEAYGQAQQAFNYAASIARSIPHSHTATSSDGAKITVGPYTPFA